MPLDVARIQAICFDIDGTLSDSDDVYVERLARKLRPAAGLFPARDPRPFARRLIMAAETPANLAYTLLDWAGLDDELGRLYNALARRRASKTPKTFRLVDEVDALLPALAARYPLAVISARDAPATLAFLERFNLRGLFACVATAQTCAHTKPFPDPLLWAAERMGVRPAACLVVGDTPVDMRMARAAGAQAVGVLCGFGGQAELRRAGADLVLSSPVELAGYLPSSAAESRSR